MNPTILRGALGVAAIILVTASALAQTYKAGALTIEAPWARATPGGAKVAGGYLTIANTGTAPDRLVGGTLALAEKGEVHDMSMRGGVMRMRELDNGLAIPAGGRVELRPGGLHLMFTGLKGGLKEGDSVRGTLVFDKAGTVQVEFKVRSVGASGAEHKH